MSLARFRDFQERYDQIIEAHQNPEENNQFIKFLFFKSDQTIPEMRGELKFVFDEKKQKLVISIKDGVYNAQASNFVHYFRNYDSEASWSREDIVSTKKAPNKQRHLFVLDLKAGDMLLNDFAAYMESPKKQKEQLTNESKPYIWPVDLATNTSKGNSLQQKQAKNNNPPPYSTISTVCKMGIFTVGAAFIAYQWTSKKTFGM